MRIKKPIAILLIWILTLSLSACAGNSKLRNDNNAQFENSNASVPPSNKDVEATIVPIPSTTPPSIPETKAVTRSSRQDERAAMYYEPAEAGKLKGEYYNGVPVTILEYVSAEWVKADITTFGESGYGYMRLEDLAFGSDGEQVEKNTMLYESISDYFILATAPIGQSGDIGPFGKGETVEVLGLMVPGRAYEEELEINRPLVFEDCTLHVKIGDTTGFLLESDVLR